MTWPPHYKIRRSKRAKNVSLRIYSGHGLEVIIPERKRHFDVLAFLNSHREWIEKHASRFTFLLPSENSEQDKFPTAIDLQCIKQTLEIIYRPIDSAQSISHCVEKNKIIFYGAVSDFSVCAPLVVKWLKKRARVHLGNLIRDISVRYDLPFRKLSIRGQKTVWGSCTAKKDIQLNYKILFLPESLAHYVLIHELCHTVHLNHSLSFWKMVGKYIPDYRTQIKALREADQFLPRWL